MKHIRITCKDGFTVSVQASEYNYCNPQSSEGPWESYEVGFPSMPVPELRNHKDGFTPDTESVFGWVPKDLVKAMLRKHGGPATLLDLGTTHGLDLGSDV